MHTSRLPSTKRAALPALLLVTAGLLSPPSPAAVAAPAAAPVAAAADVPPVLAGDTWLRHHREDLLPYWDLPAAYGDPVGNFPSFRGRAGDLQPTLNTNRGLSTLGRGVYGYSVSFMLTGDERYLTLARAGLDWIEDHAEDTVNGGYFGELLVTGAPSAPRARKDVFDLASVGMAYAAYFNATRDPAAEAKLLQIRDLIFTRYYTAGSGTAADPERIMDAKNFTLANEVDIGANGGDITNLLVPATGMFLPVHALLTDPARRAQFREDLRTLTEILVDRHKTGSVPEQPWMFWGRTARQALDAPQTDFGHNIKSYAMIHNANQVFADRPWDGLAADRAALLERAWDPTAARWNEDLTGFAPEDVVPDSGWWIHDEADQLLAALDLTDGFTHADRLAVSSQKFLDVYVDRAPEFPVRETFTRVLRTGEVQDERKSFFGKNMLHNFEHALVLYLHGRQLEGLPARLHYALPDAQALAAVATPYWFDAAGQSRTVTGPSSVLPGHEIVTVDLTGIGQVPRPPYPAPDDTTPPVTTAEVTPPRTGPGWHQGDVTVSLSATDDAVGVKEMHLRVVDPSGTRPGVAAIHPGDRATLPLTAEGEHVVTFFGVDTLGNTEPPQELTVRIDRTAPTVAGLPAQPCVLRPPNSKMVRVAHVVGSDALAGVADVSVRVTANQTLHRDVLIDDGEVWLRAERDDGRDRVYTLTATVMDLAGNGTTAMARCTVPQRAVG